MWFDLSCACTLQCFFLSEKIIILPCLKWTLHTLGLRCLNLMIHLSLSVAGKATSWNKDGKKCCSLCFIYQTEREEDKRNPLKWRRVTAEDNSTVTDVLRKILSSRTKIDLWPAAARSFFFFFSILLYVSVLSFLKIQPPCFVFIGA